MDKGPGLGLGIGYDDVNKTGSSGTGDCGSNRDKSSSPSSSLLSAAVYQHTNPLYYRQVTNDPDRASSTLPFLPYLFLTYILHPNPCLTPDLS